MVRKMLLTGLAAIIMGLTPNCGGEEDNGYECINNEECTQTEQCVEGYCEESQWPQCELKEYFDGCADFTGTYEVVESNCTNRFKEITFSTYGSGFDDNGCASTVNGIDKKSGEVDCLGGSDLYKSNQTEGSDYTFTKCDGETVKMEWNNGKCESWLNKISSDFFDC